MKARKWSPSIKELVLYLQVLTNMKIDRLLISRYITKGSGQPYHRDRLKDKYPTQVIDISLGPPRELIIRHRYIKNWEIRITLKEGYIYILTHFFNKYFEHKYVHENDSVGFAITGRNNE